MFSSPILRALSSSSNTEPERKIYYNPYKAKKTWPPDFSKLSHKHQFRLERRHRRRSALKWARPRWTKGVKMAQLGSIIFVTVYGVLFLDWKQEGKQPFQGIRNFIFGQTGSFWSRDPERVQRREQPSDVPTTSKA